MNISMFSNKAYIHLLKNFILLDKTLRNEMEWRTLLDHEKRINLYMYDSTSFISFDNCIS